MQNRRGRRDGGLLSDALGWLASTGSTLGYVWATAMVAPGTCFRTCVVERDQTRAIAFVMAVIATWLAVGLALGTAEYPVIGGLSAVSVLIWLALLAVFVAPLAVHLLAFVSTLVLVAVVPERGTVSETVQVIAYAMAPVVLLPIPIAAVQAALAVYGTALLVFGLHVVHGTSIWRALLAGVLPAYLLFGVGFGANEAVAAVLRAYTII